mmetsp:Transcript_19173/g.67681  ORF Transcript_19173/g.67681 Transcript_19173/m.67681 type:complete len:179 (-) Transcript_19173:663-1199(-)
MAASLVSDETAAGGAGGTDDVSASLLSDESAAGAATEAVAVAVPTPEESGLEARPSRIQGAGLGLFAVRDFDEGAVLCDYTGVSLRTVEALRVKDKSYLMRLGPQSYIDSKPTLHVLARYINDARDPRLTNVRFDKQPEAKRARVVALRKIFAGDEVYVDYGRWYWAASDVTPGKVSR